MSLLLGCFEPATTAASMAICRPEAIDDAPGCGPERSGGWRRGEFLASRGMPARPAGEESLTDAVASQAIEAQPSFGQIKPWRGRVVRTPNSILRRRRGGRRMSRTRGSAFQAKKRKPWRSERTTSRPDNPCKTATLPMEIVSVGLEASANPSAQTKALALPVRRASLIHRTEIQHLRR
jgi:hypothetical protein